MHVHMVHVHIPVYVHNPYIHQLYLSNWITAQKGWGGKEWQRVYANFLILHRYSFKVMVKKNRG